MFVHLSLNVITTYTINETVQICEGDIYSLGNQTLTKAGNYSETFQSTLGCDSTVNLTLILIPRVTEDINAQICQGQSYILGTQTLTSAGNYQETFTSAGGCDSIVNLTLAIVNTITEDINEQICQGQSYILGTQTLTSAGNYQETFTSAGGCDSIVNLTLAIVNTITEDINEQICQGQSYILGTQTLTSAGNYQETFTSAGGCDSIVNLTLAIVNTITEDINEQICQGQSYILGTQTLTSGGNYQETFTSAGGCDSIVNLTLAIVNTITEDINAQICQGQSYILGTQTLMSAGNYQETFTSAGGCDSIVNLTLAIVKYDYRRHQRTNLSRTVLYFRNTNFN